MIQLNLLPDVKKEFLKAQSSRNRVTFFAIVAVVGAAGLTVAMAAFVYGVQNAQLYFLNQSIVNRTAELQNIPDIDKYLTVQNQLEKLSELHANKNMYSRMLDFVKVLNPTAPHRVQLGSLEINDEQKKITFSGTTDTFESFNTFKDTLENAELTYKDGLNPEGEALKEPLFSNISVENSGLARVGNKQRVSFVVNVTFSENTFLNRYTGVSVKVPEIETTGSARQAPQPLFSDEPVQEDNE
jgi:Tfp pilus assembly protein PilN